ncbi:MAG: glycosyltransferase family 9 protein [Patescibacteria group bacterium]|nr:glycosyltransferase family 9 protein [Patescibacteria group bacterium]
MRKIFPKVVRKIAVLRAGVLGDFLICTPALKALRQAFPNAKIILLARPNLVSFIQDRYPYIHQVIGIPFYPGILNLMKEYDPRETEKFFKIMEKEGFDLAIQMHGGGKYSNPFVKKLGAKFTLGAKAVDAKDSLDLNLHYELYQNEVIRNLEMLSLIGIKTADFQTEAFVLEKDKKELVQALGQAEFGRYLVIHATATDPRRYWPVENFAQVADNLNREFGLKTVLVGTKEEGKTVKKVEKAMETPAINLCGLTTLGVLTALLSRASLVIANDSGPSHLAVALKIPTVTIFWVGNMITWSPFFRQNHRPVISWQVLCPTCNQSKCHHKTSFVKNVPLEEVINQARDLLSRKSSEP